MPSVESRRRLVADDALDFDAWDYEGGDRDSESKSQRTNSRAGVTSYVARRKGRIVTWEPLPDGSVSAKVVWASTDRYAHALVRQLTLPAAESKRPPTLGVRDGECLSLEAASRGFELPGGAALSPELRAAIERADMWPFRQRLQAVRDYLNAARVPYATGRVELKVKRGDCYGGCLKAFKKLAPKAWRMSWFLKFDGEGGLDAGGLSRDFWRLCLSRAFDEDLGLFRRSAAAPRTRATSPPSAACRSCRPMFGRASVARSALDARIAFLRNARWANPTFKTPGPTRATRRTTSRAAAPRAARPATRCCSSTASSAAASPSASSTGTRASRRRRT